MIKALAITLACLVSVGHASACSLMAFSQEFRLDRRTASRDRPVPPVEIASVRFVPGLSDSGSCDGVGWLVIELSTARIGAARLKQRGYIVRPISGVNDTGLFPKHPLMLIRHGDSRATLFWGWTGITPNSDGHVKWELELVPVTRSGTRGSPVPFCVSSNRSCPDQSKRAGDTDEA